MRTKLISRILLTFLLTFTGSIYTFGQDLSTSSFISWGISSTQQEGGINLVDSSPKKNQVNVKKHEVVVAVIDTGIDFNHPFLKNNVYTLLGDLSSSNYGMDFSNKDKPTATPSDTHGHGTHVSGIIRSIYSDVKILPLKYFNQSNSGQDNLAATIKALKYAVDANVAIINYSGGGPEPSSDELKILKEAEQKGILVVAAAGNEHSNIDQRENAYYPASYRLKNIISVTAHNQNLEILPSSNWGKNSVDLSAPGYQIRSSLPQGRGGTMTGTSQATAFVTGVAALIKANNPSLDATAIRKILIAGAKKYSHLKEKCLSGGIVNASESLELAQKNGSQGNFARQVGSL